MADLDRPTFEFNWLPVLLVAATLFVLGLVVNFALLKPGWLLPSTLVAGAVAGATTGFYEPAGNNAVLGVALGMLVLTPILVFARVLWVLPIDGRGDTIFYVGVLSLGWFVLAFTVMVPMAYIGAKITEVTRRRVGGPIGY
jgi:hypothetical protein